MSEHQGNIYMTDAKNILSKSTWFFGPTKEEKIALGIDLYCKAANQYKIIKLWDKAGFCYNEAAKLNLELSNSKYHAATNFTEAAKVFENCDKNLALRALENAITIYVDDGKLQRAATHEQNVAEILEEDGKIIEAINAYEKTYDYYEASHSGISANKILLKIANLSAEIGDYDKANINFKKVANYYIKSTTSCLVSTYKTYLLKAGLCKLCSDDIVDIKKTLTKYCSMKDDFVKSNEYKILDDLIFAYENMNADKFTEIIDNSNYKFQNWEVKILDNIKNKMDKEMEDDFT